MFTTLFSPSEGKHSGGSDQPVENLLFGLNRRRSILQHYRELVQVNDTATLSKLFGIKKKSDFAPYLSDPFSAPVMPAIERYNGVAYDYLDVASLTPEEKTYLERHVVIFSNLYGPIMGGDLIANYKVKQGEHIDGIAPDIYYKKAFSTELDRLFKEDEILDLRAGYYNKFYTPNQPYTTLKFMKGGKVVSHWAKAYRGLVLRHLAQHNVHSLKEFMKVEIDTLMIREIKKIKQKTEIVFDIV